MPQPASYEHTFDPSAVPGVDQAAWGSAPPPGAPPAPTVSWPAEGAGFDHAVGGWRLAGAPLSSPGKRLAAALLDGVLMVVTLIIGWLIWSLVLWAKGQTPGKSLLGMRCVRVDTGRAATWGTMALREVIGKSLIGNITFGITTLISMFMILGSSRQGIWDKVATTAVVDDPSGRLV